MKIIEYVQKDRIISENTKLGVVHLKVKHLKEQINFYKVALKMTILEETEDYAILGDTKNPLLHLRKVDDLKRYSNTTGMYHFALLYPNEKELAKAIYWLYSIKYPNAPTDHGFSKTSYLKDLEGNDIELYIRTVDRAIYIEKNGEYKIKYKDGRITDGRDELDLDELFSHLDKNDDIESPIYDMQMGHIHLYGSNVDEMNKFYTEVMGFAEGIYMPYFRMSDVGLTREKNHVIAFNAWKRTDIQAPEDAAGLDYYTIVLDGKNEFDSLLARLDKNGTPYTIEETSAYLLDPSKIKIKLTY
ncbi:VOC family protein [Acholeplasma hippikon]|uniref:Catechol-2,3-dioxygenase n=1 Tax=Acholeplasma hippikon TaxID=264636 RepID=A0A449BI20_9MOLU|nr:VOC family protein [Acholeplasma hippikon]VEU82098.1 Catechol-2,3-dioxygenase [Acholeplasma hippikon]